MQTRILNTSQKNAVSLAAELLQAGKLVAFPTDTVYGIAALMDQPEAVAQIYAAKGRPSEKPIPILLAKQQEIDQVAQEVSALVRHLADRFWPGGLTLIVPKGSQIPPQVSRTPSVAVRLPDLALTREIIAAAGKPLAVTSANRSGHPSPRTAQEVLAQLRGRIAAVVDGGPCPGGVPSTILDCSMDTPRLLRIGAVPAETVHRFMRQLGRDLTIP